VRERERNIPIGIRKAELFDPPNFSAPPFLIGLELDDNRKAIGSILGGGGCPVSNPSINSISNSFPRPTKF
jgi:hypothetical protein